MINVFNNYRTIVTVLYTKIINLFSYYYLVVLGFILFVFLSYRFPYCYSPYIFIAFLISVVFSRFVCLFLSRIFLRLNKFFRSFIPVGTPGYICPLVCLAETTSYIIRPVVLILRPFINIRLGCIGTVAVCGLCISRIAWGVLLILLFFYEVFVAIVHWYIVTRILSFSIDH